MQINQCFNIRSAQIIKGVVSPLLLTLSTFAVLYSAMSTASSKQHSDPAHFYVFWGSGVALLHLLYLWLVFREGILKKEISKIKIVEAAFAAILALVYIFYLLHTLFKNKGYIQLTSGLKQTAYISFAGLYLLWFIKDFIESKKPGKEKIYKLIWAVIDISAFFIILLYFIGFLSDEVKVPILDQIITPKDISVLICVFTWCCLSFFVKTTKESSYGQQYREYVIKNAPNIGGKATDTAEFTTLGCGNKVTIFDFGAGNGLRLLHLITWLRSSYSIGPNQTVRVVGYDNDESWKSYFYDTFKSEINIEVEWQSDFTSAQASAAKSDLVVFSHVLYTVKAVKDVSKLLQCCVGGTRVMIRGTAARCFFTVVNRAYSTRVFSPTISHLWRDQFVTVLEKNRLLRVVDEKYIKQDYTLEDSGDKAAGNLLGHLYGDDIGESVQKYLEELMQEGAQTVPNDDILILGVVENPDAKSVVA